MFHRLTAMLVLCCKSDSWCCIFAHYVYKLIFQIYFPNFSLLLFLLRQKINIITQVQPQVLQMVNPTTGIHSLPVIKFKMSEMETPKTDGSMQKMRSNVAKN